MALTDVDLTEADTRVVCEIPTTSYSGVLSDAVNKPENDKSVVELPRFNTYPRSRTVNST